MGTQTQSLTLVLRLLGPEKLCKESQAGDPGWAGIRPAAAAATMALGTSQGQRLQILCKDGLRL